MKRVIDAEWLDALAPENPLARRSRADLRRLNGILGHSRHFARTLRAMMATDAAPRLIDLGAGDGAFALRLARRLPRPAPGAEFVLVDRQHEVEWNLESAFAELGWRVLIVRAEVCEWLEDGPLNPCTAMIANLFLHHFPDMSLERMMKAIATRTNCFVACETHRTMLPLVASHIVALMGAGAVTRHDAVVSVRAGFCHKELSDRWPDRTGWRLEEHRLGLCSHWFLAHRLSCPAT